MLYPSMDMAITYTLSRSVCRFEWAADSGTDRGDYVYALQYKPVDYMDQL